MKWQYPEHSPQQTATIKALAEALNINPVLAQILVQRGICTYDQAKAFFRPSLENLHAPFLMKDMDKAVERIVKAVQNKEKILIYGDYDVDGTTSVSLMYTFFKPFYKEYVEIYIPDRYTEGYGVSFKGMDYAHQNGFSLVISLDCGIRSHDKIEYALERNIDFVVCDHHLPAQTLPNAFAVLDAKRSDCHYPFKELCGCGVGFKLCQALAEPLNVPQEKLHQLLDFVAIAIASDLVEIADENRVLMYHGIKQLETSCRNGLKALMEISGMDNEKITGTDLVFKIGPRINAAGRIQHAKYAVNLLISEEDMSSNSSADRLNDLNQERKGLDKTITEEALAMIENSEVYQGRKSTVLYQPHWHKGVIGIVASRVLEKHYKPTIMLTESEGKLVGSARSVYEFDIHEAICQCADLLIQYGGHKYAAGLALSPENLEAFIQKFEYVVANSIQTYSLSPTLTVDARIKFSDIDIQGKFMRILHQMGPFGTGNLQPTFVSEQVHLHKMYDDGYRIVGDGHLQLTLTQDGKSFFKAIAFGFGRDEKLMQYLKTNPSMTMAYHVEENTYNSKTTVQLRIKNIQL